jgi:hypothetical protein
MTRITLIEHCEFLSDHLYGDPNDSEHAGGGCSRSGHIHTPACTTNNSMTHLGQSYIGANIKPG